ncbi:MAG: BMP family ABC transporter substrate-binding protein [Acidimicrobiales bacterium]|jgi:basic membrane protein A
MKRLLWLAVLVLGVGMLVAPLAAGTSSATTAKPARAVHTTTAASAKKFEACMVTDTGGIDDRSFNASSWQGVQEAESATIGGKYLQSANESAYVPNINTFIQEKCGIIVTVGFLMGDATKSAAKAHPSQKFAIVDYAYSPKIKNIDALVFNTVQDGFLGGYLAAGMSKTHVVATFGGMKLPTVTIYMDGFWDGVQYYNKKHPKAPKTTVLGWSEKTQNGEFTGDFTNQANGQHTTNNFIAEKADIIFPVAGNVGLGAAKAVQDADASGGKVNMEWVDTDGCFSAKQYCKYFITSVTKGIQTAVKHAIVSAATNKFKGGNYIGTLKNGGVALSPFHDFANKVPASLKNELAKVKAGIISGKIPTPTKSQV